MQTFVAQRSEDFVAIDNVITPKWTKKLQEAVHVRS
jgi:hypothetical protein